MRTHPFPIAIPLLAIALAACSNRQLTFNDTGGTELLTAQALPAPGFAVDVRSDAPLFLYQSSQNSVQACRLTPDFEIDTTTRIPVESRSRLQQARPLAGGNVLGLSILDYTGSNFFDAFVLDGGDGSLLSGVRLNERSLRPGASCSIELSPDRSTFAFFTWEHPGPRLLDLSVDLYGTDLVRRESLRDSFRLDNDYNAVLETLVTDDGDVIAIRALRDDEGETKLLVDNLSNPERTIRLPLPNHMARERVKPNGSAHALTRDGDMILAVGMQNNDNMKGMLLYRLNLKKGSMVSSDSLHLTRDAVRRFSDESNLKFFIPHTVLPNEDGSFVVIAEGMRIQVLRGRQVLHRAPGASLINSDRLEVESGDIVAFGFDKRCGKLWGTTVAEKRQMELWHLTISWDADPVSLLHGYAADLTSSALTRGNLCTILYATNRTLYAADLDPRNGSIVRSGPLFEMTRDDQLDYRNAIPEPDSKLLMTGIGDDGESGSLVRIRLP